MSKSLGTGIDPLEMIDRYGADATRFGLLLMSSIQDVRFSEEKIEMGRGTSRTSSGTRPGWCCWPAGAATRRAGRRPGRPLDREPLPALPAEEAAVAGYEFSAAADALYHFVWDEFCDWYLEMVKVRLYGEDEAARGARPPVTRAGCSSRPPAAAPAHAVRHRRDRRPVRGSAAPWSRRTRGATRPGSRPTTRRRSRRAGGRRRGCAVPRRDRRGPGQVLEAVFAADGRPPRDTPRRRPARARRAPTSMHDGGREPGAPSCSSPAAASRSPPASTGRGGGAARAATGQG